MKYSCYLFILLSTVPVIGQQLTQKTAFLEKWNNSKEYLIEMAESMPESMYNYKPTDAVMNFKEQLLHISENMLSLIHIPSPRDA